MFSGVWLADHLLREGLGTSAYRTHTACKILQATFVHLQAHPFDLTLHKDNTRYEDMKCAWQNNGITYFVQPCELLY